MTMNDELSHIPADQLEDALAMLAAGISLKDVLAKQGRDAEWLRPMLELAVEVENLQADIPIPAPDTSLQRLLDYGQELTPTPSAVTPTEANLSITLARFFQSGWRFGLSRDLSLNLLVMALIVIFLTGGLLSSGLVLAAEGSVPGQPLYRVKQMGEAVRLRLTQDSNQREQLLESFNKRRLQEIELLLGQGKTTEVAFISTIESSTAKELIAANLDVQITSETEINGQLAIGARVRVQGVTQPPDGLLAQVITVIEPPPALPAPPATSTPSSTSTSTPTTTTSPIRPTATNTPPGNSISDTIRSTPTPIPSATPTTQLIDPTPTEVPTDDGLDSVDNLPSPTVTVSVAEPTSTDIPSDNNNDNDRANTNDNTNANDNDNTNANDNSDSSNSNSGSDDKSEESGGDDSDSSDSNSGSDDDSESDSDNSGSGSDDNSGSESDDSGSGSDDND
jgi:hypothetical protein